MATKRKWIPRTSSTTSIWFTNLPSFFMYTFLSCCSPLFCSARDTMRYGDRISWDDATSEAYTLVSAEGRFELGFFTPTNGKLYVGIWYRKSPQTRVWVANRKDPVLVVNSSSSTNGVFAITEDGNLQVLDEINGKSYWSTDLEKSSSSSNRTVTLMDSGNLVLREKSTILWESFRNPTDTFLPGMKMDKNLNLTSWRDQDDPGPGEFRFQKDQDGFVIMNKVVPYWKSGEPSKFFGPDEMPDDLVFLLSNFRRRSKSTGSSSNTINNKRLVINSNGTILYQKWDGKAWTSIWWEPRDNCSVYNFCGNFGSCNSNNRVACKCLPGFKPNSPDQWNSGDFSGGCSRETTSCPGNYTFLGLKMMKVGNPESAGSPVNNETECRNECLDNCNCQAYSFQAENDSGTRPRLRGSSAPTALCWIWLDNLKNLQEEYANRGRSLFVRVALADLKSTPRNCQPCGTTMIPYPLSTGPDCGDPTYSSFQCDNATGRVYFTASSGVYRVLSIDPNTRKFVIQVRESDSCGARNSIGKNPQLNQLSPFSVTNWCLLAKSSPKDRSAEVEIGWEPPQEPTCISQASCKEWPHSTCSNAMSDGKKRCLCSKIFKWDGIRLNCTGKQEGGTRQSSKEEEPSRKKSQLLTILLATVIGVTILSSFVMIAFVLWRRNTARKHENRKLSDQRKRALRTIDTERRIKDLMDSGEFKDDDDKSIDVPFFDLESILAATDDFSDDNKLGQGGYGPVYKGNFPEGQAVAIKRLSSVSGQGLQEFKNEVLLIARLQHRNLVRLRGYCMERDEKILLYEYMPNKSLDSFIFDDTKRMLLDWTMRFDIILGIARGLLYLHQDSRLRIIHRDLKTSNILLDQEMNPKISDFGLARMVGGKQTEANTSRVVGTYGYMSPEYALEGVFSVKSDVFSFGVVLLEIISGKRITRFVHSEPPLTLVGYAWRLWTQNKVLDLMDQTLHESCIEAQFIMCVNVGLLCVQEDPSDRPNMSNVITMLDSESATIPAPKQPAFVLRRGSSTASSSSKLETHSEITFTVEEGR